MAASPAAPALRFADTTLSYAELDRRANRLAHHLRALGVQAETWVGLCLPRGLEIAVAVLAVLRAGGGFVPLDPDYPVERLDTMARHAGLRVLVHDGASPLDDAVADHVVDLRQAPPDAYPDTDPGVVSHPDHAAYLIFTSGSSGVPKGVVLSHRGINTLAEGQRELFAIDAHSRILQYAALSFDAMVSELVTALGLGACLVLADAQALLPGPALAALLAAEAITHLTLPPSSLALLPARPLPALRCLVVAGETCPAALVARWAPGRRFVNAYGPTEATVCASGAVLAAGGPVTIGRPLPGVRLYVLDRHGEPLPPGLPGELHIGGPGLARGYLGDPARSAAAFVPDPFDHTPGARLYRSGDRVRWTHEGELEFLGRLDRQVKLRGFRIEPGEVQARLARHPAVAASAVVVREDPPAPAMLVAYVVSHGEPPGAAALREYLARALPDYMLPGRVVYLDELPRTPAGKLDRRRLPAPDTDDRQPYQAPDTDTERLLASLWEEILGVRQVGLDDDFFELGGHSLLALRLITRLREQFQVEIPLPTLFQQPRLREQAIAVENAQFAASGEDELGALLDQIQGLDEPGE